MSLSAVLFDVGETLWHSERAIAPREFRRLAAGRCAAFLAGLGFESASPEHVARRVWDAVTGAAERARATDLVEPDYVAIVRKAVAAEGLALGDDETSRLLDAIYVSGTEAGKAAYPEAAPVLLELRRRGFRLAVVTNRAFGGERFRADLRETGLDVAWDAMAVSVEVGYLKPHPRMFHAALDALALSASEALMVGNSLIEDIAGAQRLGMCAAWRRCEPDAEGVVPDYTLDSLEELLTIPALAGTRQ